jgi:hypothetical protein
MSWPWHWYSTGPVINQAEADRIHAAAQASGHQVWIEARSFPSLSPATDNRRVMSDIDPMTDLPALHDALDSARFAAFAAEGGDRDGTSIALMEASAAAASAFASGSREADALGVIFTAISRAVPGLDGSQVAEPELGD